MTAKNSCTVSMAMLSEALSDLATLIDGRIKENLFFLIVSGVPTIFFL